MYLVGPSPRVCGRELYFTLDKKQEKISEHDHPKIQKTLVKQWLYPEAAKASWLANKSEYRNEATDYMSNSTLLSFLCHKPDNRENCLPIGPAQKKNLLTPVQKLAEEMSVRYP